MLILILLVVIALVAWSLHLMQEAITQREFSLMLAGTLVAASAAALVGVYFLMGNYMGYMTRLSSDTALNQEAYESLVQYLHEQELDHSHAYNANPSPVLTGFKPVDRSVR
jgi:thiol:disulfide interchange protein